MFRAASAVAISVTAFVAIAMTVPGLAQNLSAVSFGSATPSDVIFESSAVVQPLPDRSDGAVTGATLAATEPTAPRSSAVTLSAMVRELASADPDNAEQRCLAIGVYYESRAESLAGQLAVADVIINRSNSRRFASSICGVLTQPRQFSFVRGGVLPSPGDSAQWRTSVGVARVAMSGQIDSPVPGAMFFHATHVSPGWNRPRVARLGNHIFYR